VILAEPAGVDWVLPSSRKRGWGSRDDTDAHAGDQPNQTLFACDLSSTWHAEADHFLDAVQH
jgi:hypothetical protein